MLPLPLRLLLAPGRGANVTLLLAWEEEDEAGGKEGWPGACCGWREEE